MNTKWEKVAADRARRRRGKVEDGKPTEPGLAPPVPSGGDAGNTDRPDGEDDGRPPGGSEPAGARSLR